MKMTMARKRIVCKCDSYFATRPTVRVPWDDVYLRWNGKPGRRVYYASPCLVSGTEIPPELTMHEEIRVTTHQPDGYRDEDARLLRVLEVLETQEFATEGTEATLNIYTKAKGIDRREAERMLSWWLDRFRGIRHPKFVWVRPEIIIMPIGIGNYTE